MAKLFFSYSHADEVLRDRLEKHLALLKHQGLIETWHDRRILAGDDLDAAIDANLEQSDIILLLVSADFMASRYCFSIEMARALELHAQGRTRVIPVILDHCDWHSAPFKHLMAVPRDGKPVTAWPQESQAWTDVARTIRAMIEATNAADGQGARSAAMPAARPAAASVWADARESRGAFSSDAHGGPQVARSSNLRLKKEFTEFDRDKFLHEGFEFMARFFEASMIELETRNAGIQSRFQRIDASAFSAIVYRNGKAVAQCSIRVGGSLGNRTPMLSFSYDASAPANTSNEMLHVEANDQELYFKAFGMNFARKANDQMSQQGASDYLWDMFIERLQ